jgi:hypothetical protein
MGLLILQAGCDRRAERFQKLSGSFWWWGKILTAMADDQ